MKPIKLLILATFLIPMHVGTAAAYLDPGTGSILLQGILALIAGAAFTLKLYWTKVKSFFAHEKAEPDQHGNERN
jgi:hypothetical protein